MMLLARQMQILRLTFLPAGAALLYVLHAINPEEISWFPNCPFHRFTGLDCPGCGSIRGLHSLLNGNVLKAADYNLLLMPALLMIAVGLYQQISRRGQHLWAFLNRPKTVLIVICTFWVLRNIPLYPFWWLNSGH